MVRSCFKQFYTASVLSLMISGLAHSETPANTSQAGKIYFNIEVSRVEDLTITPTTSGSSQFTYDVKGGDWRMASKLMALTKRDLEITTSNLNAQAMLQYCFEQMDSPSIKLMLNGYISMNLDTKKIKIEVLDAGGCEIGQWDNSQTPSTAELQAALSAKTKELDAANKSVKDLTASKEELSKKLDGAGKTTSDLQATNKSLSAERDSLRSTVTELQKKVSGLVSAINEALPAMQSVAETASDYFHNQYLNRRIALAKATSILKGHMQTSVGEDSKK